MRKPELLSPAGDFERLEYALAYGADACYLAGKDFGMRTAPGNFTGEELEKACKLAHSLGKRVYVTVNTMPRSEEAERIPAFLDFLQQAGADAAIIADLGVLEMCKQYAPRLERHISTQANITNYQAAEAWHKLGAHRVVLARELSLQEVALIREKTSPELAIEVFVHGAMCMSYSGRCYLSAYLTGRDGNRGACAQPCRWQYSLVERQRPGQVMDVFEGEEGAYILNSKDLCMLDHIPELIEAGVDSFKIEGRAKTAYYTAITANAYRRAIDLYCENPVGYALPDWVRQEVEKVSHREYYTGFYFGDKDSQRPEDGGYQRPWEVCALSLGEQGPYGPVFLQKNRFSLGDELELIDPVGPPQAFRAERLLDEEGQELTCAPHPHQHLVLPQLTQVQEKAFLRRRVEKEEK